MGKYSKTSVEELKRAYEAGKGHGMVNLEVVAELQERGILTAQEATAALATEQQAARATKVCSICEKKAGFMSGLTFQVIKGKEYCHSCAGDYVRQSIAGIQVTTTSTLDGYYVARYLDIESVEIAAGTGMFSEFGGDIADFFGARSTAFEKKLQQAKRTAIDKLKFRAFECGGNAVIGIDLDYTEFSGNRIGLIANGTIVEVVRRPQVEP